MPDTPNVTLALYVGFLLGGILVLLVAWLYGGAQ